jgi:hypothetical protein
MTARDIRHAQQVCTFGTFLWVRSCLSMEHPGLLLGTGHERGTNGEKVGPSKRCIVAAYVPSRTIFGGTMEATL